MRRLLGRSGLSSDETASEYFYEDGKLICVLWGQEKEIKPCDAVIKLRDDLAAFDWHFQVFRVPDDQKRAEAISKTIEVIKDEFREAAED